MKRFFALLALVLAAALVLGSVPGNAFAAETGLSWKPSHTQVQWENTQRQVSSLQTQQEEPLPTTRVRVAILLEQASTAERFSTLGIAANTGARAYDAALETRQARVAQSISQQALGGETLDMVWNLTLITNLISANVPYGSIEAIRAVPGVREVVLEQQYAPQTVAQASETGSASLGSGTLGAGGNTGAGTRIAVIDTGVDTDHQALDNGAYLYALEQNAADTPWETYLESIDLLDVEEISRVLDKLNAAGRIGVGAEEYYVNEKFPFGANYVDRDLVIDHDRDSQGDHGSHVTGIAAANRFVPQDGGYADALQTTGVCGVAPDAQVLVMKIFGKAMGPYDSDYFAAMEDAIWLGCDSVNLSLGSADPGASTNGLFSQVLDFLTTTDTVVVVSAGNSGQWAEATQSGLLYADDVSFHTGGAPGSYTNALTVASVDTGSGDRYTMSAFSAWGVPGSLELKPELAAPGGSIRSLSAAGNGDQYQTMSGTSMAAPQVSGMAALVARYIQTQGLDEQTGLTVRQLTQSLLMSTAQPLLDGESWYPVLQQGAGLAQADPALSSGAFVLVEGQPDGKVKAELGDDPERLGSYTFSFSLTNLREQELRYALSAELFTQALETDEDGTAFLSTRTRPLGADASFRADGQPLTGPMERDCDLNGDGVTNGGDADYLLEYLLGNETVLYADGDVNADGQVNTYDAHLLLRGSGYTVTVPAGESVTIEVRLGLTAGEKALLEQDYPAGAYVEGFILAEPLTEGEPAHSIPVLGYYGSWTDPGMFEVGSRLESLYGTESRPGYLQSDHLGQTNYLTVKDGTEKLFGGNPITTESEYLPRRNALSSTQSLSRLTFTLIRNSADTRLELVNTDTGEVCWTQELGAIGGAYYHTSLAKWENIGQRVQLDLRLDAIPEGTAMELRLGAAPEYYQTDTGETDWDALEEGAFLRFPFTIDNTAPELLDLDLTKDGQLLVTAQDEQYVAAAAVMNPAGTTMLAVAPAEQTEAGTEITTGLDLSGVFGQTFLVALFDYAENVSTYQVTLELDTQRPRFTAVEANQGGSYVGLETATTVKLADRPDRDAIRAAESAEGAVFEITGDNRLFVGYDADLAGLEYLADLNGEYQITGFNDLAYSTADGKLYGNFYSQSNQQEAPFLCTIDLDTGEMEVLGELPVDANAMTVDDAGNFYAVLYGKSSLYTFRADVCQTGAVTFVGSLEGYATTGLHSMAWDHDTGELFWACTGADDTTTLLQLDPRGEEAVRVVGRFDRALAGLYIAVETPSGRFAPTDRVDGVGLPEESTTLVNNSMVLQAQVYPWYVREDTVTWTSSDASVATVDAQGLVTGHSAGTAVITAASALAPEKTAQCLFTVSALGTRLNGLIWDENGAVWFGSFRADDPAGYTKTAAVPEDLPLTASAVRAGRLYVSSMDTQNLISTLYEADPETFALTQIGGTQDLAYTDLAYLPSMDRILATFGSYVVLVDPATGEHEGVFNWYGGQGNLVGITYYGSAYNEQYGVDMDYVFLLDDQGRVFLDAFLDAGGKDVGYFNGPEGFVQTLGDPVDTPYFQGFHYDGEYIYWSRFSQEEDSVELLVWDRDSTGNVYSMGRFPEGVWPVGGLYTDEQVFEVQTSVQPLNAKLHRASSLTQGTGGGLNGTQVSGGTADGLAVPVTLPEEGTNGRLTITYDPEALELTTVTGTTLAFAHTEVRGQVTLAFAEDLALAQGATVAVLHFLPRLDGPATLTVHTGELGSGPADLTREISLELSHWCACGQFVDVAEHQWFHEAVDYVASYGYMKGMDASHFGPDLTMTRAQFVTVLYRLAGEPEAGYDDRFTDVARNTFYTHAVAWAAQTGITTGVTETTFEPEGELTRTELIVFLYRYAGYCGYDRTADSDLSGYQDASQILPYGVTAWHWGVYQGMILGRPGDILDPMTTASRAEAAAMFQRFGLRF